MPARDLPENPSVTAAKRAASVGSFSQASSFEEVRFEELEHSDSDSERAQAKAEANSKAAPAITTSNLKPGSNSLTPTPVPETAKMHMVDSENDLLQPQSKKDITLRELHDPIEGDSADISWRGNHDLKANAGNFVMTVALLHDAYARSHSCLVVAMLNHNTASETHVSLSA